MRDDECDGPARHQGRLEHAVRVSSKRPSYLPPNRPRVRPSWNWYTQVNSASVRAMCSQELSLLLPYGKIVTHTEGISLTTNMIPRKIGIVIPVFNDWTSVSMLITTQRPSRTNRIQISYLCH